MSLGTIAVKTAAKMYVSNKITGALREGILSLELSDKVSTGAQKFEKLVDGFWDKVEGIIQREKEIDRPFLPNVIEDFTEDVISDVIADMRKSVNIQKLAQKMFDKLRKKGVI